jgi:hypothetical protein
VAPDLLTIVARRGTRHRCGSTLLAARRTSRRAVGIDFDAHFCEFAADRVRRA